MANEITDLKVQLISLVRAGANKKTIIYKQKDFSEVLRVDFKKEDGEEGVVYGIVYAPLEIDTQGDYAKAEEIKKAAYDFMKRNDLSYCIDVDHNFDIANAYICESWIVKSKDEFFTEVGAWAVGIKLEDERLKEMVKNGEITGLSMYGSGIVKKESFKETMKSVLVDFFKKDENLKEEKMAEEKQEKIQESVEATNTTTEFKKALETSNEKVELLVKSVDDLKKEIGDIKKELSKSKQSEEVKKEENKSNSWGIL